jgi:hypothetical protein
MAGRRKFVAVLAAVIALLLSGAVAGIARTGPATVGVSTTAGPPAVEAEVAAHVSGAVVEAPPGTVMAPAPSTTAAPATAAPRTTAVAGRPKPTPRRDQPVGRDEVGSAADLGAGEIERTVPARCTPTSEPTPPHAIAVVEVRLGCVRSLVPAGTLAGPEVSWSPDGTWLLTTVEGRVVRMARDGSWRQDLGGGGQATVAVLSPDGARMAVVGLVPSIQRNALVLASADGSGATVVGQVEQMMMTKSPVWSLDSQVLAVISKGSPFEADVLILVGADGRVRASRSFPDRALHGTNGGPLSPGPASLGKPVFMPDGRLFQPAFVELPRRLTGLWLNRALADVAGLEPPSDLMFADGVSVPGDGSKIAYVGAYAPPSLALPIRRVDLRTGETVTLAADGAVPSASHRTNAVAFVTRSPQQAPTGLSVVDASGATRPLWRHAGISCICVRSGIPAWTPDDAAVAIAT